MKEDLFDKALNGKLSIKEFEDKDVIKEINDIKKNNGGKKE